MNDALRTQLLGLGYRELTRRCSKHPHASEGAARAQLRSITKEQERKPDRKELEELEVYYHKSCGNFHVGHNRRRDENNGEES